MLHGTGVGVGGALHLWWQHPPCDLLQSLGCLPPLSLVSFIWCGFSPFLLHLCSGYWDFWGRGGFKGEEKIIFVCFLPRLEGKWKPLMGWLAAFLVHFCFLIQRFGGPPGVTDGRGESFPSGRSRGRIYFRNTLQWRRGRGCGWHQVSPGLCSIREDISWDVQEAWGWS